MEVATYCIRLGAASIMVEPGFPGETSYQQRQKLIGEFSTVGDGVLATVDVEDIIRNAPRKQFDCNMPLHSE